MPDVDDAVVESPVVLTSYDDGVAVLTLDRPAARNAINGRLADELGAAIEEVESRDDLRVTVLTGTGSVFCAGADLKAVAAGERLTAEAHPEWGLAGFIRHPRTKPVIVALNGHAVGGGAEIVLTGDLAVMSEDAVIGLPEVKRGLFAAAGGLIRLPRAVPAKIAAEVALTGDPLTAADALRWGLVNRVVPAADVLDEAIALARRVAANAPLSLAVTLDLLDRSAGAGAGWDDDVWQAQDAWFAKILASEDAAEGTRSFIEKRAPQWRGR